MRREVTDQFGILHGRLVLAAERVLETLGQLPQLLVLRLPRHGGGWGGVWWFAVRGSVVAARV
jgi:hypothetical protein